MDPTLMKLADRLLDEVNETKSILQARRLVEVRRELIDYSKVVEDAAKRHHEVEDMLINLYHTNEQQRLELTRLGNYNFWQRLRCLFKGVW